MSKHKEEIVKRFTESAISTSNDMSRWKTEMEAAFRKYSEEDMDLSKLDRLKDAIRDLDIILRSTSEEIDKQTILLLRRSQAGRGHKDVQGDSGFHSGGIIAEETEEPINHERRRDAMFINSMSLEQEGEMQENNTESGVSSTNQTNDPNTAID